MQVRNIKFNRNLFNRLIPCLKHGDKKDRQDLFIVFLFRNWLQKRIQVTPLENETR